MFEKNYEERLEIWSNFRQDLESSSTPFTDVISFFSKAPKVGLHLDPWDKNSWPNPWEMILENKYCEFISVLGWLYSLQLTERFSQSNFEIHIFTVQEKGYQYCLFVDDYVLGFSDEKEVIKKINLPKTYKPQVVYPMSGCQ